MQASEILSAALDGEHLSPGSVAHAREHCARCPECTALLVTMERVAAAPQPRAPEKLVARILTTVQEAEAARIDAEAVAHATAPTTGVVLPLEPVRPRRRIAPSWWQPRFTPIASAAVVVLAVSTLSTYVLVQMTRPADETMTADYTVEIAASDSSAPVDGALEERASSAAAGISDPSRVAPPYVVWDGTVWVRADGSPPDASTLAAVGVITSDLGEPEGAKNREVLTGAAEPETVFVRTADEDLIRFTQVTRSLGSRTYALVAGAPIPAFGAWPSLPPRYPTPAAEDGSPVFVPQGLDDRGREVFAPVGADTDDGFAIAPGTPRDDPAAGNPGWTWWEPVD